MGRVYTRVYLYDQHSTNKKGTEYTKYLLMGDTVVDNLDDTIDTAEITLAKTPYQQEFDPTRKFIIEKWENVSQTSTPELILKETFSWCVSEDIVEKSLLSEELYDHHISLINPAVIAQKRLCDNMAVTYKLKDVNINVKPTYDPNATILINKPEVIGLGDGSQFGDHTWFLGRSYRIGHNFTWEMPTYYQLSLNGETRTPSWDDWNSFKVNQEIATGETSKLIELPIPMLKVTRNTGTNTRVDVGYCSLDVLVTKTLTSNPEEITQVLSFRVDPNENSSFEAWVRESYDNLISNVSYGDILSKIEFHKPEGIDMWFTKLAEFSNEYTNRKISFIAEAGYTYNISINRHQFNNPNTDYVGGEPNGTQNVAIDPYYYSYAYRNEKFVLIWDYNNFANLCTLPQTAFSTSFYGVSGVEENSIYLQSNPNQENAFNLFVKSQITTQNFARPNQGPVLETKTPFVLNNEDKEELKNTVLVENFYHQQNLWQVFMDIGKYIHAKPVVKFNVKDTSYETYLVEFNRYGRAEQFEDKNTKVSINNSRFVADYISALSSYVTNMVQLGGTITEVISPKSTDNSYTVTNDLAKLIVSKPIIEIVSVKATRYDDNGTVILADRDLTQYVYEKNVYQTLPVNKQASVNKGLAIYYELGSKEIQGLQYTLPSRNTDEPAAIKNILQQVFNIGDVASIKLNNFSFNIVYRTKDTLRTTQTRPDWRKYLKASDLDRVPIQQQFNNQTDTLVDSEKFGNNVYGKLIRTGNQVIVIQEWCDSFDSIKKSGQLINFDGYGLFYVSKVTSTYYADHIECEVEYSKDFNRFAQIIGIPSEPRFYEISEQSSVDREVQLDTYLMLGDKKTSVNGSDQYLYYNSWQYINDLLFNNNVTYPKYAVTSYKHDIWTPVPQQWNDYVVTCCYPISAYAMENTLTFEWDNQDNFSAGDQVIEIDTPSGTEKNAYLGLNPYRYGDIYGRADLLDFAIISDYDFSQKEIQSLPENPITIEPYKISGVGDWVGKAGNTVVQLKKFTKKCVIDVYKELDGDALIVNDWTVGKTVSSQNVTVKVETETSLSITVTGTDYTGAYDIRVEVDTPNVLFSNEDIKGNDFGSGSNNGIVLMKDNREVIKLNHNIQMLTASDRFVISPYMWQEKKTEMKLGVLNTEINKIGGKTLTDGDFWLTEIPFTTTVTENATFYGNGNIVININEAITDYLTEKNIPLTDFYSKAKAICIYNPNKTIGNGVITSQKYFVFGKNIDGESNSAKLNDWQISTDLDF